LTLQHGKTTIIESLNLILPLGKVTSIVGPNSFGESTLLNIFSRIHHPTSGSVLLNGKRIHKCLSNEVAHKLALLPQDTIVPDGISVTELIRFGRHPH
jgi:iron complex transport system ATP-binding protein